MMVLYLSPKNSFYFTWLSADLAAPMGFQNMTKVVTSSMFAYAHNILQINSLWYRLKLRVAKDTILVAKNSFYFTRVYTAILVQAFLGKSL